MGLVEFMAKNVDKIQFKLSIYKRWLILAEELYISSEPSKNTPHIGEQRKTRLFGTILFLAFALESFINDIGITYCKEDWEWLEKLPTPYKWLIIPKLKSKGCMEKLKDYYQAIKMVFVYRNLFVHFKPEFKKFSSKDYTKMLLVNHVLVKSFFNKSVIAMRVIAKEFKLENSDWLEEKKL